MARSSRFSRKPRFGRFRRKRRVTWFPVIGSIWNGAGESYFATTINIGTPQVEQNRAIGPSQSIWPITKDYTIEPGGQTDTTVSLRDYVEGQNFVVDRIVGSIPLHIRDQENDQTDPAIYWRYFQVAAGIFVSKVSDADQTLPMGVDADYDPFALDNAQNPWMWRRTWLLNNPDANITRDDFPLSNIFYQEPMSANIDIKVKRRIKREERLFLVVAAMGWNGDQVSVSGPEQSWVEGVCDLRILGHMVRGRNDATF